MGSSGKFHDKTKEELILELKQIQESYVSLKKSFTKIQVSESRIKNELTKRKNELQVLFKLSSLMKHNDLSLSEIFEKIIEIIPSGWQYPEITCARILLDKTEYKSKNFESSAWKQSETILIDNQPGGTIEVFYLEQKPDEFEGPFLKEERNLLQSIAERLGKIATRKQLEEEFITIFRESPVAKCIIDLDREYRFANVNDVFLKLTKYSRKELINKRPKSIGLFKNEKITEKMLGDIYNQGFIKNLQYDYVTKDGEVKTTILNTKVININGRNLAIASFIDLTEILTLKKAEQEINEFNQLLIESIPFGIEIIDESGSIIFANQVMKRLFGHDIIGKKCWHSHRIDKKPCTECPLKNGFEIGKTKIVESEQMKGGYTMEVSHTGFLYKGERAFLKLFTDVTEKKKAEKELIETKEKLQDILDNLDDAYFQIDLAGNITYVNPAAPKMFGYSSAEEMLGIPTTNLYALKKDRESVYKELNKANIIFDRTFKAIRKDSSTFWISMNAKYIYDEHGKVKGVQGLIRDITKRKETEILLKKANEEIEKSEIRFKAISEQAMDGIALTDMEGRYVFVNKAFCKMMGYPKSELLHMTIYDLKNPDDRENILFDRLKQNQKKGSSTRTKLLRKDKSYVYVDLNGTVLNIGNDKMILGVHRDVTELVLHENEMIEAKNLTEKSESRYRRAQEVGHIGSWEYDLRNNTFWGSDEGKRIYNLDLNKKEFPVEEVMNCVIEEDRDKVNQALIDLINENKPYDIVFTIIPKSTNEQKIIRSNAEVLKDKNNNPIKVTGVLQDITLQKHFEKELIRAKEKAEENQSRIHTLINTIPDLVWLKDTEGIYLQCNKRFEDFFGAKQNDIIGKTDYDFVDKQTADFFRTHDKKAMLAGGPTINEEQITFAYDGHKEYLETIKMPLYDIDKKIVGILGIGRDITQRISVEKELIKSKEKAEESEMRFRTIAEHSTEGITVADLEGNYVYVNNAFCKMSGYSKEELLQMTVFDMGSKNVKQDNDAYYREENVSGQKRNAILRKKDGTDYHTEITGTFIEIDKQKLILGAIRDISEIVNYQNDLIAAKEKAEESDRLKSAFLMNVSHEIRTPMNGILGFINLMKEPDLTEEERISFIDIVNKSGERLLNTINDIVEISKIEIGDIHLEYEDIDASEILRFHADFFKIQANEKGVELKITKLVEGKSATLKTDRQKLDGILMNLIKNAIKFTAKGTIEVGNYVENEKMFFYVTDSGKGIPEDKLNVIFDRFVQVELGNTRSYEGSGIGLSIVKAYAEALHGDIQVKSELGKGSTFLFSIPCWPVLESTDVIANKNGNKKNMNNKRTLLIAEDDEVNYYFMESILSKEYEILHTESGEETVKIFMENPGISLILMDIKMPGEYDGYEATRIIREMNLEIPIIAQTAYAMESDRTKALDSGCNDYISKPYSPKDLMSLIKHYCNLNEINS